jgi:hypothetical protein
MHIAYQPVVDFVARPRRPDGRCWLGEESGAGLLLVGRERQSSEARIIRISSKSSGAHFARAVWWCVVAMNRWMYVVSSMPVVPTTKDRSTEYGDDHVRHNPLEKGDIPDGVI